MSIRNVFKKERSGVLLDLLVALVSICFGAIVGRIIWGF